MLTYEYIAPKVFHMNILKRPLNYTEIQSKDGSVLMELRKGLLISTALVAIAASVVLVPVDVSAQQTWDPNAAAGVQGGAGDWDAATANWTTDGGASNVVYDAGAPAPEAIFSIVGGNVNVNGGQGITDLSFTVDGYSLTGSQLAIHDNGSIVSVAIGTASISNQLSDLGSGTGALSKIGAGTLVLSGANTYQGDTNINAGTLQIAGGGAISNTSGTVNVAMGATLNIAASESINGLAGAGNVTIDAGQTLISGVNSAGGTLSGVISGDGGFTSNGTTQILTGVNTYTGITAVNNGVLELTGAGALNGNGGVAVSNNATLRTDGGAFGAGQTLQLFDTSTFDVNGDETIAFYVSAVGTTTDIDAAANFTVNQSVAAAADGLIQGAGNLTKAGAQSLTLSNAGNSLSGTITVTAGTLTASAAGALGSTTAGGVDVSGGILDLGGATHTKQTLLVTSGDVTNGTMNVTGFFGDQVGVAATISATGYTLTAAGGAITALGTSGVSATNATAAGISFTTGAATPDINNAAGDGINLSNSGAGGNVDVTLGGNVQGSDDGIEIVNSFAGGTVTINGTGDVTGGNAIGNDGITISAQGDVTIGVDGNIAGDPAIVISAGAGNILVNGVGSVVGVLQAMNLDTTSGNITVSQDATAAPGIQGGTIGIDARSSSGGNITINGTGDITGQANEGVLARTFVGNGVVNISHDGEIEGATVGVIARSGNAGQSGTGTVTVNALQAITGLGGHGVSTRTDTAINTVTGVGTISGTVHGILAVAREGGDVLVTGTGATTTSGANGKAIRADAEDGDGNVTVTRSGVITSSGAGGDGIDADVEGAGNINIISGVINLTNTAGGSVAISADDNGAGTSGSITIDSSGGAITVAGAGGDGINARLDIAGDIGITSGVINLTNAGGGSRGVNVFHNGTATGDITVNSTGTIDIAGTAGTAFGIRTVSANTGNTDINVSAAITLQNTSSGSGIRVQNSNVAPGDITIDTTAAGDINGARRGVRAEATGAANTGNITVTLAGDLGNTDAPSREAVRTRTVNGTNTVTGAGNFTGTTFGIDARSAATLAAGGGNVEVSGTGDTTSTGAGSTTINAVSNAMNGNVLVNRAGTVTNNGAGPTTGINAAAVGTGTTTVTTGAAVSTTAASTGVSIQTSAADGATLVTLGGNVTAGLDGVNSIATGIGAITITGNGDVTGAPVIGGDGIQTSAT